MGLHFAALVRRMIQCEAPNDPTRLAAEFVATLTLDAINVYLRDRAQVDLFGLVRDTIGTQPSILKLAHAEGFLLELVHWYPAKNQAIQMEQEDVHDHFGTIVSRALIGSPYRIIEYEELSPSLVVRVSEREFVEGSVELITPDTIHTAITSDRPNALSVRVVFPFEKPWMRIFCPTTGRLIRRIPNADERRVFDLAYTLSQLDRSGHHDAITALNAELKSSELLTGMASAQAGQGESWTC